jgi:hypothetical protein
MQHGPKSGASVLIWLLHLIPWTSCETSHAKRSEGGLKKITACISAPECHNVRTAHRTRASAACESTACRHICHNAVNDLIVKRSLASMDAPAILEPNCLFRDDEKRLDVSPCTACSLGSTNDAWCDTLAASHLNQPVASPGAIAL